jgi:hypothetical protein
VNGHPPAKRGGRTWVLASIGVLLPLLGALAAGVYLYSNDWSRVGFGGLAALAALVSGGLLGFLFGIPRSQHDSPSAGRYAVNTNLEQISDWLTKILIGAVLIQLGSIGSGAVRLFEAVGSVLGTGPDAGIAAGVLLTFFAITGFLAAYVLARTELPRMFATFDSEHLRATVETVFEELSAKDSDAMRLVLAQLDDNCPAVDGVQLRRVLADATPALRQQAFLLAEHQRRTTWRDPATKARMTRTVPIFRALTEIEPTNHRYWGELGFALKDQTSPDRAGAVAALDSAIQRRGDAADNGWELYEFVRALARAGRLGSTQPENATATEASIKEDLAVAMRNDWIRRKVAAAQRRLVDRGEAVDYADLEIERLKPFLPR